MSVENSFIEEVLDRLANVGEVTSRKMFGGVGIFHSGLMFALIADNELYLKADNSSSHFFERVDSPPFSFQKAEGKVIKMSYYLAPESFFEDIDETILWSERAQDAALRAARKSVKKNKKNDTN